MQSGENMAHLHLDKFRDTCEVLGHDIDYSFLKLTLLEVMLYFELKMKSHKRLKVIVGIGTKNLF